MAKFIIADMIDASFIWFQQSVDRVAIATAQPTTYANWQTYAVGTLAAGSANFTLANGDATGRKMTYGAATITVGTSGTVTHIAFAGTDASGTLLLVGTCAPTSVTATGTVILSAWDVDEIGTIT